MPKDIPEAVGHVLKKYRNQHDWSQMKLAMDAGMHLNAYGRIERGEHCPSLPTIFLLCKALGLSVGQFMAEVEALHSGR